LARFRRAEDEPRAGDARVARSLAGGGFLWIYGDGLGQSSARTQDCGGKEMVDPELERQLNDCRVLLKLWSVFQQFFESAVSGEGVRPENEKKFLELKSRVAMLHDTFLEAVPEGGAASVAQGMVENIVRSITLKHVNQLNGADVKKMQIEWHESYLLLNETIGHLEEKQIEISRVTKSQWQMMQMQRKVSRAIGDVVHNMVLRVAIVVGAVLVATIVLPIMGVFSYRGLLDIGPIQKPAWWVANNVVRQYINKNFAWRDFEEAKSFGRRNPTEVFTDYETQTPERVLLGDAAQAASWIAQKAKVSLAKFTPKDILEKSKEYKPAQYLVGGDPFIILYFLMETVPEANDAVQQVKTWMNDLDKPIADAVSAQLHVTNHYNLVIICFNKNTASRDAFLDQCWGIGKVKR
jgi:hypothetical protein